MKGIKLNKSDGFLIILIAFVFHMFMIVIYQLPPEIVPNRLRSANLKYINPQFHYNFAVFAPEPAKFREKFLFRCYFKNGEKSRWIDKGEQYIIESYHNRFNLSYKKHKAHKLLGKRLYQAYNYYVVNPSIQHLGIDRVKKNAIDNIVEMDYYNRAAIYSLNQAEIEFGTISNIDSIEFAYLKIYVEIEDKQKEKFEGMIFPKYNVR